MNRVASSRLSVLLSGRLAGAPGQGGASWAVLQYILGLRRLGHRVVFVEPLPHADPQAVRYFRAVVSRFALQDCAGLLVEERRSVGLEYSSLVTAARNSDLLLNISGVLQAPELMQPPPVRAFLDLDPAFTQLWARQGIDVGLDGHTHYLTIGLGLGRPDCDLPLCGREWLKTLPPVVLEQWMPSPGSGNGVLTTVANWRSYGSIRTEGGVYGQKAHSLRTLISLPSRTARPLLLALSIHPAEQPDLRELSINGWRLADPVAVAGSPERYRNFISRSWAEFGLAKSGYVLSRCGWPSDRSACYLASGRPVLAQDTGLSDFLPMGEGLLSFESLDSAVEAIGVLEADYARHARAARAIAEAYFDSDKVLSELLDSIGGSRCD